MNAMALDNDSIIALLSNVEFAEVWLAENRVPTGQNGFTARSSGGVLYLLGPVADKDTPLAIIAIGEDDFLGSIAPDRRAEAMLRILQVLSGQWDPTVVVPLHWKPYHHDNLISFQTNPFGTGIKTRAYVERSVGGTRSSYLFEMDDEGSKDLGNLSPRYDIFRSALNGLERALHSEPLPAFGSEGVEDLASDYELGNPLSFDITRGRSFREWQSHLTIEQAKFVKASLVQSMRLKGSAGTGKTLAMVIKFLKECYIRIDDNKNVRAAFLTHSFSTAELIRKYLYHVDERNLLSNPVEGVDIAITTLHDFANSKLQYDMSGITPISLDGHTGRVLQMELLDSVMDDHLKTNWVRFERDCSADFRDRMSAMRGTNERIGLLYDLMNEFACVIDVYGSKNIDERKAAYRKERRLAWMMPLTASDKDPVLDMYSAFRRQLREMETISTDQMIADFVGYLDSFRWDAIRSSEGFDFIFVDELHLFNRQERLTFHMLTSDPERQPVVVVAYDPKQSPRDTFLNLPVDDEAEATRSNWKDTKLGEMKDFEFEEVFRYTPEIEAFLKCLDQSFPTENFSDEWIGTIGRSVVDSGPKPTLECAASTEVLYRKVFPAAAKLAKRNNSSVAVLCVSHETFGTYLKAGLHRNDFVAITSREDFSRASNTGRRFVLSMPEFVAGLQFETVFLIDANSGELITLGGGVGAKRRLVSTLYLGASRAERYLKVYSNEERGGIPDVLQPALASGVLERNGAD